MPDFNEPLSRNEAILQNCLGANNDLGNPQSRIEELLMELLEALSGGTGTDGNAVHYTADTGKTDAQKAQARANIDALGTGDLGTVFTFKGSVETISDLPASGNSVGDVYFVEAELANFVWLIDDLNPGGFWDEFGQPIDLSVDELKPTTVTVTGTTPSITASDNTIYNCGELTSLTISSFPASGTFWIVFESGATPTTVTGINNADGTPFAPEANKRYKITVEDGYASFLAWSVGGGS